MCSGRRDGQTMMIRQGNKVEAHQWVAADGRWVKIGDVTGGESGEGAAGGKKTFKGKVRGNSSNIRYSGKGLE
jgi:phospholipase A-2-activating protein